MKLARLSATTLSWTESVTTTLSVVLSNYYSQYCTQSLLLSVILSHYYSQYYTQSLLLSVLYSVTTTLSIILSHYYSQYCTTGKTPPSVWK